MNPPHPAPELDGELADLLDDLAGFSWIPGFGQILAGIRTVQHAAASGQYSLDATQTTLTLLGNPHGPDLQEALALLAQDLTNPDTNQAIRALDPQTAKEVQTLGEHHVHQVADYAPRDYPNEAAALITEHAPYTAGGRCEAMTDAERKELSEKVAEVNRRSESRPRPEPR